MIHELTDLKLAANILKDEPGQFYSASGLYELYKYKEPGVTIVFYPHKTSAHNYHTRVMNQNSKNAKRCKELIEKLNSESGYNCTFTCKTKPRRKRK